MPSIAPLTLLPPQASAWSDPGSAGGPSASDVSFGDVLRQAQARNADPADDGADSPVESAATSSADPSQQSNEPADAGTDSAGPANSGDKTGRADKAVPAKKAPPSKAAAVKKKTKESDETDADAADGQSIESELPVEDSTAKQPKKTPAKVAAPKATLPQGVPPGQPTLKPEKVELSKKPKDDDSADAVSTDKTATVVKAADGTDGQPAAEAATADGSTEDPAAHPDTGLFATEASAGHRSAKGKPHGNESTESAADLANAAAVAVLGSLVGGDADSAGDGPAAVAAVGTSAAADGPHGGPSDEALAAGLATPSAAADAKPVAPPVTKLPPQQQFVEDNHPKIVTGVTGELLPGGGTMQIRLDPPELGALQVTIHMKDGVMSAAFETSSDDSTRMLSHSLGQLKSSLEAGGVTVEKMHVQQSPKKQGAGGDDSDSQSSKHQDAQGQTKRDQQRQELIKQMWRKLAGGDPLDLVA